MELINMEQMEIVLYTKIKDNKHIIVTIGESPSIFYVKIENKWSFNKIEDIGKIIMAFHDENLNLLEGVHSKNAILHDLYDAKFISREEMEKYRE